MSELDGWVSTAGTSVVSDRTQNFGNPIASKAHPLGPNDDKLGWKGDVQAIQSIVVIERGKQDRDEMYLSRQQVVSF